MNNYHSEGYRTVPVPYGKHWIKRLGAFIGPGFLVGVGYMDPGNWATGIAGGSAFGYTLLWVVALSSVMAVILQILAARLGIASGMDLAQACRARSSRYSAFAQWILCEIAICACDLAEVIGTAIALNLLFGLPLIMGVLLTAIDVLLILWLQQRGFRYLEALIATLIFLVVCAFTINLALAQPVWRDLFAGLIPSAAIATDQRMLYIAIGILGATVMPHNLYLHSSVVQTRRYTHTRSGHREAAFFASIDVISALAIACLINGAILCTAAAAFNSTGHRDVVQLQDAYHLLTPLMGTGLASTLFAMALLAAGQSSTITATLAGQIVMEGYMHWRLAPWARRLATRLAAIAPAVLVIVTVGDQGLGQLLLASQVVLSMQLPFAMVPLIYFCGRKDMMKELVSPWWLTYGASAFAVVIITSNALLLLLSIS